MRLLKIPFEFILKLIKTIIEFIINNKKSNNYE